MLGSNFSKLEPLACNPTDMEKARHAARDLDPPARVKYIVSVQVHHVVFRSRQVERLARFYEHVLGLPKVGEQPGYSIWLGLGDAVLMIERAGEDEPEPASGDMHMVAFSVTDEQRRTVKERLTALGRGWESESQFTTYFRDPDGRRVGVSTYDLSKLSPT